MVTDVEPSSQEAVLEKFVLDYGFKHDPVEVEYEGQIGLICEGWASKYDEVDATGEYQMRGAFNGIGDEWAAQKEPLVLWQHGLDPLLTTRQIGRGISYKLLPEGLYTKVFIPRDTPDRWQDKRAKKRFQEIYDGIKSGSIKGKSVGGVYSRIGKALQRWSVAEISITDRPCLESATFVLGTKALTERYGVVPAGLEDSPKDEQSVLGRVTRNRWSSAMGFARQDGDHGLHDYLLGYEPSLQGKHDSEDCALCADHRDMLGVKAQTATMCACCDQSPCACSDDCLECGGKDSYTDMNDGQSGIKASKQKDAYLVAEGDNPSDWHLPVKKGGTYDRGLCGAAWAALHGGYRGQKYQGPKKAEALAKLKRIYKSQGWDLPGEDGGSGGKSDEDGLDADTVVQQATEFLAEFAQGAKSGRRHSKETLTAINGVIEHLHKTFGLGPYGDDAKDAEDA